MKCMNCGKELDVKNSFSFQVAGRMNVGYECDCGYTTYPNFYLEKTPPVVDCAYDFHQAILSRGGSSRFNDDVVHFRIPNHIEFMDILSQCDFNFYLSVDRDSVDLWGKFVEIHEEEME